MHVIQFLVNLVVIVFLANEHFTNGEERKKSINQMTSEQKCGSVQPSEEKWTKSVGTNDLNATKRQEKAKKDLGPRLEPVQ